MSGNNPQPAWKSPTPANIVKYHLRPLPDDFEPTEEEKGLLAMYDTIKKFERQAIRLKEQKVREKLAAKDAEFKHNQSLKRRARRRRRAEKAEKGEESSGDDSSEGDDDDEESDLGSGDEMDPQTLVERRAAKLEALRDQVEEKKQAMAEEETRKEHLRDQLLATNEDVDLGPALKRKKLQGDDEDASDLLASMVQETPPHDFSKKLGLKAWKGKVLFPSVPDQPHWTPPRSARGPNDGAFLVELENFDISKASDGFGNNTVAIKFNAPSDSRRFSINIAGPNHDDFNSVLLHFNPRQFERGGQLVINDKKEGMWGQAITLPMSQVPLVFGRASVTLLIQINGDGFDIFIDEKHCARLEHRTVLPSKPCSLFLQFPSCDDYMSPENWLVYKTWWGNKAPLAKHDLTGVAGVKSLDSIHPKKLFVSSLRKVSTQEEVEERTAELERAFRKYGGARGVTCVVPLNSTFAFVELETERMTELALTEMSGTYRLKRARRSKHEALQAERKNKEGPRKGKQKDTSGWY